MKKIILFSFLLGSCSTFYKPDVWDSETNSKVHTLRLYTGSHGYCLYEDNFKEEALKICPNGYNMLEKTYTPSTLHKKLYDDSHFSWVIECK